MEIISGPPRGHSIVEKTGAPKIHALTSARFFAAIFVVIFHTQWGITPGGFVSKIAALGYIAPYFFFALSGYILAEVYLRREQPIQVRMFFNSRFARIYPLYYVSLLMTVPFAAIDRVAKYGVKVALERVAVLLLGSTFMLQMWLPVDKVLNIPSWTLAIETVFYLSFPWLGPWIWRLRRKTTIYLIAVLYISSVGLETAIRHFKGDAVPALQLGSLMAVFSAGILLSRWQVLLQKEGLEKPGQNHLLGWIVFTLTAAAFLCVAFGNFWLKESNMTASFLLLPIYLSVIWILAKTTILPSRLLSAKWLVVLGESSYALYLIQLPVLQVFKRLHLAGSGWDYPLYLGTLIGLSVLSFYFFETPMRRWILHKLRSRTKETMEAASAAQ